MTVRNRSPPLPLRSEAESERIVYPRLPGARHSSRQLRSKAILVTWQRSKRGLAMVLDVIGLLLIAVILTKVVSVVVR